MAQDSANTTGRINVTVEEVICKFCSKFYSSPKLVECLHSFCQSCIQQHLVKETNGHVFVCPKCLHVTKTGDSSAASLTSDLHVPRLLEVFKYHMTAVTPCTICTLEGNEGEATHRCLSCNDHLCTSCSKKHTFSSLTATHRVVSLADLRSGKYDQDIMRKQTLLCKEHDQQECEFFCNTCSGPQCTKCIITKHRDHSYVDIKDATETARSEMLTLLQGCEEMSCSETNDILVAKAEFDLLKNEESLFVKTVKEQTEQIIKKIKQQSYDCLQKATKLFKEERTRRQMKKDVSIKRSEKRQNILKLCRTITGDDSSDIIEMASALKKGVALISNYELSDNIKEKMTTYKASVTSSLNENIFEIAEFDVTDGSTQRDTPIVNDSQSFDTNKSITQSNKVEQIIPTEESAPHITHDGKIKMAKSKDEDTPNPERTPPGSDDTKVQTLKLKFTFSTRTPNDWYVPGISAMAMRLSDRCFVLDNVNGKLKEYRLNGSLIGFVYLTGRCEPFRKFIVCHLGSFVNVVTVVRNFLLILTSINLFELKTIKIISQHAMKCEPLVANFSQGILVGNLPGNGIMVYNIYGSLLRGWKSQMKGPFEFLKYAGGDRLLSSNWKGNGSVSLESEKNGLLVNIPGQKRFGLPWRPTDGVIDNKGNLVLSDPNRNEISIFSSDGSQLFCHDTSADAVLQPNCFFVDNTGLIYVSFKDGKVAVYRNERDTSSENLKT